jgi:hypothetical protein
LCLDDKLTLPIVDGDCRTQVRASFLAAFQRVGVAAVGDVSWLLGIGAPETVRKRVRQAEVDAGKPGAVT